MLTAAAGTWAARRAPEGTFILPGGRQASLASLHGRPAVLWFIAGGCASCAASVPAVAAHLGALARSGTRILVLGMYGAFGPGARMVSVNANTCSPDLGCVRGDP